MTLEEIIKNAPEGATHYTEEDYYHYLAYYKDEGNMICVPENSCVWLENKDGGLERYLSKGKHLPQIKTKVVYEKVTEFNFDLRKDFEEGKLYFQHSRGWM